MRTSGRSPLSLPHRALSALMALIYSAAMLSGLFHMVEVKHEVCADHGELVHASATTAPDHQDGDVTVATLSSHDAGEHGHCGLETHLDASARVEIPQALGAPVLIAGPLSTPMSDQSVLVVREVLDDAPKQGPPTV